MLNKHAIIKVGTSTLTYENNKINLQCMDKLCKVITDIHASGHTVTLVSSGAIGVGLGKMNLKFRPDGTVKRQALAAVGQCQLMFMYSKMFGEYNQTIAQILLTPDVISNETAKINVINTFNTLYQMGVIPVVNENDSVATDELESANFGDNDTLSAIVAQIVKADVLIMLTDTDGLYDSDPRINSKAKLISRVDRIDEGIRNIAKNTASNRGTGGMSTKVLAADMATSNGIDCYIMNGSRPEELYDLFKGKDVGTLFKALK